MLCDLRILFFFFSSRRRHTRSDRDWSSDVCSSDLVELPPHRVGRGRRPVHDPRAHRQAVADLPHGHDLRAGGDVPPKAYAGKQPADISRQPIGTGPYTFVRWAKDEEVVLEANTAWWRGEPKVKTVVFRPIPDDAVRVAALQNGEIDVAVNIPPHLANPIPHPPRLFLATAPPVA